MGATKQDKIDSLATKSSSGQFRVPTVPKALEFVRQSGLKDGLGKYDEAMETWARDLEKSINERIIKANEIASGNPG